jgi:hypothetical protein
MSTSVQYTWQEQEGDMWHVDIIMVMWQHQRLPHLTKFWRFQANPWTNRIMPRGSLYGDVARQHGMMTW